MILNFNFLWLSDKGVISTVHSTNVPRFDRLCAFFVHISQGLAWTTKPVWVIRIHHGASENYVIKIGKVNWGLVDKHNLVVCYNAPPDVFVA